MPNKHALVYDGSMRASGVHNWTCIKIVLVVATSHLVLDPVCGLYLWRGAKDQFMTLHHCLNCLALQYSIAASESDLEQF